MSVRIKRESRLQYRPLVALDGYEFFDFEPYPEFPERDDDTLYPVKDGDRPDLLGRKFYGDPSKWWVIAVANNLELIPSELYVGQVLRIPNPGFVQAQLFRS